MTYWFVKWLAITFIIGDICINLIKPLIFIEIVDGDLCTSETLTWAKSWLLICQ